jgi:hypothetical protein
LSHDYEPTEKSPASSAGLFFSVADGLGLHFFENGKVGEYQWNNGARAKKTPVRARSFA